MNLETFFEKFTLFVDAPDAVEKMRELVLQLAVQGQLVDQLPSDEPATKLLERIRKSKERLIKERLIRRQECSPISGDAAPFCIPKSWVWTRLGEIGDWGSGSTPTRGNHNLYDGGITWLKSGELNDNQALAGSSETVTELALKTGSFRRNQPGDVLFAMYGATIGKVAILAEPAVTNQAVCGCTPFEGVSNLYLFIYLLSQRTAFHAASEGGAQPNLSKVKIVAFPFPLPPMAEQKRIVAKVDELMALCDSLALQQKEQETRHAALARASLARFADAPTPANLKFLFHKSYAISPVNLRKSILTLAVQGKLVPQDSNDEPAEAAISRIGEQRERLIAAKQFRKSQLPESSSEGSFDIPYSWIWTNLGNAMLNVTDGFHSTPKTVESGVPYVTAKHVKPGRIDFDSCLYVSVDDFREIASKTRARRGDVLVVNIGAGCGLASIIEVDFKFAFKNVAILNRPEEVDPSFLFNYLVFKRDDIFDERTKGGAQPFLSLGIIREIQFPLPPLSEQRRIVAKVDELMALVDALETQLATARTTATTLLTAAIAELTNGKECHATPEV